MKDIEKKVTHIDELDINVNNYLSLAQIDAIAKSALKFDSWVEREANINALLLYFATDIDGKEVEERGLDYFVETGIIDIVRFSIENTYYIYDAIKFMESTERGVTELLKTANDKLKELQIDKIDGKKIATQLAKIVKAQNDGLSKK